MNHDKVSLGVIPVSVQKALRVDWKTNRKTFILEKDASELAHKYSDNYLKVIEEMASIVKSPSLVMYDTNRSLLYMIRVYLSKSTIRMMCVTFHKRGMLYFKSFDSLKTGMTYPEFEGLELVVM